MSFTGHEVHTTVNHNSVTYHNTTVFEINGSIITLRTGGWTTKTTMRRINQAAKHFRIPLSVWKLKHHIFVDFTDKYGATITTALTDGMTIDFSHIPYRG